MATRVVNGNSFTEDGWPLVDQDGCNWVIIPGTNPPVTIQIQKGQPTAILRAWEADWNAHIEPLRDADTACWTKGNSVLGQPGRNNGSNHLSGTATDSNWNSHPFQRRGSFNAAQLATMQEMLDFYEGTVFWAGVDWSEGGWGSPIDEMHSQMGYNTYGNPHTADFIARKIRADGFSTFRRGNAPSVMTVPLIQNADGRWTSPSPAWAHLIKRESGGNPTIIQQIIDVNSGGNEAEGLFQITPRTWRAHNGDEFATSPRFATPQQQAIVAARIFTRNPSGSDWGAGLPSRENAQELAAGLVPVESPAQPEPLDPWEELMADTTEYPSLSMYDDGSDKDTLAGRVRRTHAFLWDIRVEDSALRGEQWAIAKVVQATQLSDQFLANHAKAILAQIEATNPQALKQFVNGAQQ